MASTWVGLKLTTCDFGRQHYTNWRSKVVIWVIFILTNYPNWIPKPCFFSRCWFLCIQAIRMASTQIHFMITILALWTGQEEHASSNGSINQYESVLGYEDLVKRCHVRHLQQSHVVCYAAKLKDYPGKLLPKVAISLGVPKGPMFRLLKDGQTVTLPNGKKVMWLL